MGYKLNGDAPVKQKKFSNLVKYKKRCRVAIKLLSAYQIQDMISVNITVFPDLSVECGVAKLMICKNKEEKNLQKMIGSFWQSISPFCLFSMFFRCPL